MPGTNAGTGRPLTFQCAICRRSRYCRGLFMAHRCRHTQVRTGRTRPLTRQQQGRGGPRVLQHRVEYRCECGHVGWSRHVDVERLPLERADP